MDISEFLRRLAMVVRWIGLLIALAIIVSWEMVRPVTAGFGWALGAALFFACVGCLVGWILDGLSGRD